MSEWIKCSERLPEDGYCLIYFDDGACAVGWPTFWHGAKEGEFAGFVFPMDELGEDHTATHWMPLPAAPEEE